MSTPVALIDGEEWPLARLDRHHIELMAKAGVLEAMGRFELIDGVLVRMSPSKSPHGLVLGRLSRVLGNLIEGRFEVGSDIGVFFGDITMRAPDLCLCPVDMEPGFMDPDNVHLAIEIADSTLDEDLKGKARLYASSGLPEYWVVDIAGRCTHIHRQPELEGYARIEVLDWTASFSPLCAPDATIRMDEVTKGLRF